MKGRAGDIKTKTRAQAPARPLTWACLWTRGAPRLVCEISKSSLLPGLQRDCQGPGESALVLPAWSTHLSFLPVIFTRRPRADGLPEGPCSQGRRGPRSGDHVTRSQSRRLSDHLRSGFPACLPPSQAPRPSPHAQLHSQPTRSSRARQHTHAHACTDVPARPLLTRAVTPSLTLGACPREPGLARDCQHPPHLHTHTGHPHSLTLTHTPRSGFSEPPPPRPQYTTAQRETLAAPLTDMQPRASSGPL